MKSLKATIVQENDVDLVFLVRDKQENPISVSSATAITFNIKKSISDSSAIVSKSIGDGVTVSSPDNEIVVSLTDVDTAEDKLPAGKYYFELKITDAAGLKSNVRDYDDKLGELTVLADT
jgi:hypothetical protein